MSYKLFLDDVRSLGETYRYTKNKIYQEEDWYIARNYKEFVELVEALGLPDIISFDHDLADEHYRPSMYNNDQHYSNYYSDGTFKEKTGYECAIWLCDYHMDCNKHSIELLEFPQFLVHSMNPIGKKNIETYIQNYIKTL